MNNKNNIIYLLIIILLITLFISVSFQIFNNKEYKQTKNLLQQNLDSLTILNQNIINQNTELQLNLIKYIDAINMVDSNLNVLYNEYKVSQHNFNIHYNNLQQELNHKIDSLKIVYPLIPIIK